MSRLQQRLEVKYMNATVSILQVAEVSRLEVKSCIYIAK